MARAKKKVEDPWAAYRAAQLTPEQKAAARAELQQRVDQAKRDGVYVRLLELEGKVHLDLDLDELREDRD